MSNTMGGPGWYMGPDGKWYPPDGWQPPAPTGDPNADQQRPWAFVVIGSAALMLLGSLLPWVTAATGFGSVSKAGTEGDGVITLGAALVGVVAGIAMLSNRSPGPRVMAVVVAVLVLVLVVYEFSDIQRLAGDVDSDFVKVSPGIGLWLVGIAALGTLVGGATSIGKLRK